MNTFLQSFILFQAFLFLLSYQVKSQTFNWAKSILGDAGGYCISLDANGNSYLTGAFAGTTSFGTLQLTSYGNKDIFIAKYDPSGNCLWVKNAGGKGDDYGLGISADALENRYITGFFTGTATFGTIQITAYDNYDIFIAKYDLNGNCLWAEHAGGSSDDIGSGISVDANGNSYVTGSFYGTATFGTFQLSSPTSSAIFIAKYDPAGNCLWADQAGGTIQNSGESISIDANGNSYITGWFYINATFGTVQLNSIGAYDIFIAKYNSNGNFVWVKQAGSNGNFGDEGRGISVDANGNSYVTGYFADTAKFGTTKLTSYGGRDIYIAKYDLNGKFLWAKNAGGTGDDFGQGISIDANGNSYITGYFTNTAKFGATPLTGYGGRDIFIAKYDLNGNFLWAKNAGGTGDDFGQGISADTNGNSYVTGGFTGTASFGTIQLTGPGVFFTKTPNSSVGIKDEINFIPKEYSLQQNYPNPFNPGTTIKYSLPYNSNVRITIYNSLGQMIKEIVSGFKSQGNQEVNFNASALSSGVYLYSIRANSIDGKQSYTATKKMLLLK